MENFAIPKDSLWLYGAYWAEMLARHLLHVEAITTDEWFSCKGRSHFDIDDPRLNVLFEIKLSANNATLRIFMSQLERQLQEISFPQDMGYLWLFSYRSVGPRSEGRKMLFKEEAGGSWETLSSFLASHLLTAYLVDLQILRRQAAQENGTRFCKSGLWSDPAPAKESVRINRRGFVAMTKDPKGVFRKLGIPSGEFSQWLPPGARQFRPRTIETEFDGHPVSFRLNLIVPNGFKNRFLRRLNGTVKRIEKP